MKRFAISLLLVLFAANAHAKAPESETFNLSNGMQVVVIPNTKVPAVSHMVWYKAGAQDEPVGKSGIAHFLEHLMFKGTNQFPKGEFSKIIANAGGNDNAFTSTDYTAYFQNISKERLETVMELESNRMQKLVFDEEEVAKERQVILEERSSRIDNEPSSLLGEQMKAALFLNHPYGKPLIGWRHEMEKLSADDAKKWYENYYAPNNAILIVSGDITAKELRPLAEKYYGVIQQHAVPNRVFISESPHIAARNIVLYDDKVAKPEWTRYYMVPSINTNNSKYIYAITLLSHILGESDTSRLYQRLVVEDQVASSVGSYYDDLVLGPSIFVISGTPANGHSIEDIQKSVDAQIEKIRREGIFSAELDRAKNSLIAETIYEKEDLKSLAYLYGQVLSVGAGIDYINNWEANIKAVSPDDIKKAAELVFNMEASVTGELRRDKK